MKQTVFKKFARILVALAFSSMALATASAQQPQQNLQLAAQLGALQLGYKTPASAQTLTPSQLSAALAQGEKALKGIVPGAQLSQATSLALSSPITSPGLGLNPALTTPAAILNLATARDPALATSLVSQAVAASLSHTTDAQGIVHPTFGPQPSASAIAAATTPAGIAALNSQTEDAQRRIAAESARIALNATLTSKAIGMNLSGKNITPANTKILADAAALVTQNAISGLGGTAIGLYGKTDANVLAVTQQLTVTTTGFYQTLISTSASGNSIASLSGSPNLKTLLGGVVTGALNAAPSSSSAIATGLANGYYVGSLNATQNSVSITSFKSNNTPMLVSLFNETSGSSTALTNVMNEAVDSTHTQIAAGAPFSPGSSNPGKYGVNQSGLLLPTTIPASDLLPPASLVPPGTVGPNNATGGVTVNGSGGSTGFNGSAANGVGGGATPVTQTTPK